MSKQIGLPTTASITTEGLREATARRRRPNNTNQGADMPKLIPPELAQAMTEARRAGGTLEDVALEFGVSRQTVIRHTPGGISSGKRQRKGQSGPRDGQSRNRRVPMGTLPTVAKDPRGHRRHTLGV